MLLTCMLIKSTRNNFMLTWCCLERADFSLGTICVSTFECDGCEGVRRGEVGGGESTPLPDDAPSPASNETRRRFASCTQHEQDKNYCQQVYSFDKYIQLVHV